MPTLNKILHANGSTCLIFGIILVLFPSQIALFLSSSAPAPCEWIIAVGCLLLCNSGHLFWVARSPLPSKWHIVYFSLGDMLWVLGTMGLVITHTWITNSFAIIVSYIIALLVGTLGALQLFIRQKLGGC